MSEQCQRQFHRLLLVVVDTVTGLWSLSAWQMMVGCCHSLRVAVSIRCSRRRRRRRRRGSRCRRGSSPSFTNCHQHCIAVHRQSMVRYLPSSIFFFAVINCSSFALRRSSSSSPSSFVVCCSSLFVVGRWSVVVRRRWWLVVGRWSLVVGRCRRWWLVVGGWSLSSLVVGRRRSSLVVVVGRRCRRCRSSFVVRCSALHSLFVWPLSLCPLSLCPLW